MTLGLCTPVIANISPLLQAPEGSTFRRSFLIQVQGIQNTYRILSSRAVIIKVMVCLFGSPNT